MIMKDGTLLDSVKMLAIMLETCKIGLQWSINRNVPSSERFKSRRGCVFQTQGLDSVDDNERWDCVGFCKNACIHVWGHVKLGCNGVLIERFRLVKGSRAEGGVAFKHRD